MKPTTILTFITVLLTMVQCGKEDEDGPVPVSLAAAGTMISSIDGAAWSSTTPAAVIDNGVILVTGTGVDATRIDLYVAETTTGTYTVDGMIGANVPDHFVTFVPAASTVSNPLFVSSALEVERVGEIKITEIDDVNKTVSGTFQSKVKRLVPTEEEIQITNGSFTKITYTTAASGNPDNTASAKIDNVAFAAIGAAGANVGGKIMLSFYESDGISLNMPNTITPGTYALGSFGSSQYGSVSSGITVYISATGSLVITLHNTSTKRIEGTFNFNAQEFPVGSGTVSVTEGVFAVTYN